MHTRYLAAVAAFAMLISCPMPGSAQDRAGGARFDIVETSIDDIHAAFRAGTLTARGLVQRYLDRIAAYDKRGNMASK